MRRLSDSCSSSVSSESSESLSRPALVGSAGLVVSGGGEGEGDGELRESSDVAEPGIVVYDEEDRMDTVADNKRILEGTCARIPHDRLGFSLTDHYLILSMSSNFKFTFQCLIVFNAGLAFRLISLVKLQNRFQVFSGFLVS